MPSTSNTGHPALLKYSNEGAEERDQGRVDTNGSQNKEKHARKAAEPRRGDEKLFDNQRVEGCDGAIGDERDQDLGWRHGNLPFDKDVYGQDRRDIAPPLPVRHEDERDEKNGVGGQNGAKNLSESVPMKKAASAPRK